MAQLSLNISNSYKRLPNWQSGTVFEYQHTKAGNQRRTDAAYQEEIVMGRVVTINLEHTPWPASILKYNEHLGKMRPGDRLVATVTDTDIIRNLEIILKHTPALAYRIQGGDGTFRIESVKGK